MSAAGGFRLVWRDFGGITVPELHGLLALRCAVFVAEQRCAYLDVDGRDAQAWHLLAYPRGSNVLAGCLRVLPIAGGSGARIGRLAVAPDARGFGLGRRVTEAAIERIEGELGAVPVALSAQAHLERFYASLGFEPVGEIYDDAGIPHRDMVLQLKGIERQRRAAFAPRRAP